ncbi:MAG: L-serine ammonia-lyase, iron-sulfur-dependent, subunit alpha [Oscillospiraceae bacterium]
MIEKYNSIAYLKDLAVAENKKISQLVFEEQIVSMGDSGEEIFKTMSDNYDVMIQSINDGFDDKLRSTSGITGGDAARFKKYMQEKTTLTGDVMCNALSSAIAVSEYNAAMGKIVAAPTGGSCGILPAALVTIQKKFNLDTKDVVMSMFTAGAVGMVIANCASLSGAEGGCQAECGSAAAMAAAALTELSGGTPEMVENSVAIALKNILGLVCDPVAGLVEVPCIKRNASGVANAFISAELALAGIKSVIPADEVIIAMKKVGDMMHPSLKETANGGLAKTPTAKRLYEKIFGTDKSSACANCNNKCQ